MIINPRNNTFDIFENITIRKPQYTKAEITQELVPGFIFINVFF
jgi:hypothetical protein